jgi:putative acetyltransferase
MQIVDAKKFPLRDEDIRMLAEIETHPKVMEWDVDIHTTDINEMHRLFKEFFEKLPNNKDQIFLVGMFDDRVIGFLGIHCKGKCMQHVGVVGITIHPDYWGRGFGTELLRAGVEFARKEGFLRLEADTLAKNKAMIRVAEKAGFKREGVRKMRKKMNGKYEDEVLFAMILE